MFNNIGKKIKLLAKVLFFIEALASLITGIALIGIDDDLIVIGLIVMAAGVLLSWITSWFLYGFGEIVDKLCDIERNTRGISPSAKNERKNKLDNLLSKGLITQEEYDQAISK